jgi:hypothetical protein
MIMWIIEDFEKVPHLFQLSRIKRDDFNKAIQSPPKDLIEFWAELGAGEIFETETIYSPSAGENDDTVIEINEYFAEKGMPSSYTVFHTGMTISAYRAEEPRYVILDEETFEVVKCFNSFEEWYSKTLRTEYAERYGMNLDS